MKKILVSMFLLVFVVCLVGCSEEPKNIYEDEYFTYSKNEYLNDNLIYLTGLTEKGKEQEVLLIPSEYNGNKVIIKSNSLITTLVSFDSEKLKKIYISEGITGCGNLNVVNGYIEIIILSNNIESIPDRGQVFVTSEAFERKNSKFIMPANVSYNCNYEEAPNSGYYWIDDYDNELIDYIPTEPIREGYKFVGWYKEPECINEWDFENDIIPAKVYNSDNEYQYQETILYAKWEKIN